MSPWWPSDPAAGVDVGGYESITTNLIFPLLSVVKPHAYMTGMVCVEDEKQGNYRKWESEMEKISETTIFCGKYVLFTNHHSPVYAAWHSAASCVKFTVIVISENLNLYYFTLFTFANSLLGCHRSFYFIKKRYLRIFFSVFCESYFYYLIVFNLII